MTKLRAFSIHFAISFAIFLFILYFIIFHWYPQPFFSADGGWQGIRIVAGVDLVLGPLLTLVVFKAGKPRLKLDMSIIALIQISALISGTWIVHKERPVAIVFTEDKFIPIPGYQFEEAGFELSQLREFGTREPVLIFSALPTDKKQLADLKTKAFLNKQPLYLDGRFYQPITESNLELLKQHSINMPEYVKTSSEEENTIYQDFLKQNPTASDKFFFLPLHSRFKWGIVTLNPETLEFESSLDITPPTDLRNRTTAEQHKA